MYYLFETQVTPLTTVRRQRILPAPGELLVRSGQRVEPAQPVARTDIPGDFRILPLARLLGVAPARIKRHLRVAPGETVQAEQVIAKKIGRVVKSPIDGVMVASGNGLVLIQARPTPFELCAYIPGVVANVLGDYGVVIETSGVLIQGIWGTGGESFGVLKCLVDDPQAPLRARALDPSCHGMIIVGGSELNGPALEMAQELQIRGIVTGGLPPELIPQAKRLSFPIIVTDGIGKTPMADPIFRLLKTNDGREAAISGQVQSRWDVVRPEVVIPLPANSELPPQQPPGSPLTVGTLVRAIRAPYTGKSGAVVKLPARPRLIDTGVKVRGAEVDLGQEAPVFIPLANLEILR